MSDVTVFDILYHIKKRADLMEKEGFSLKNQKLIDFVTKCLKTDDPKWKMSQKVEKEFGDKISDRMLYRVIQKIKQDNSEYNLSDLRTTERAQKALAKKFKAAEKSIDKISEDYKSQVLFDMAELIRKAVCIKTTILEQLSLDLAKQCIPLVDASRVLGNLGLSTINVAKMLGVQLDGTQDIQSAGMPKDGGSNDQVQLYLPDNGR